jgi:hypothetical protein
VFASTLALMGLLETKRHDLPWDGSTARRDELIVQTARWLIGEYRVTGLQRGWVNNIHEEHANDIFDGLTAETYCALMLAENAIPGVRMPEGMYQDLRQYLVSCGTRKIDYAIDVSEMILQYRHINGETKADRYSIRYLWWPWAIRCADLWLQYAEQHNLPMEQRVEVRRAFAHLVIDLGPKEVAKVCQGYSYVISEDLWCLRKMHLK